MKFLGDGHHCPLGPPYRLNGLPCLSTPWKMLAFGLILWHRALFLSFQKDVEGDIPTPLRHRPITPANPTRPAVPESHVERESSGAGWRQSLTSGSPNKPFLGHAVSRAGRRQMLLSGRPAHTSPAPPLEGGPLEVFSTILTSVSIECLATWSSASSPPSIFGSRAMMMSRLRVRTDWFKGVHGPC